MTPEEIKEFIAREQSKFEKEVLKSIRAKVREKGCHFVLLTHLEACYVVDAMSRAIEQKEATNGE